MGHTLAPDFIQGIYQFLQFRTKCVGHCAHVIGSLYELCAYVTPTLKQLLLH